MGVFFVAFSLKAAAMRAAREDQSSGNAEGGAGTGDNSP